MELEDKVRLLNLQETVGIDKATMRVQYAEIPLEDSIIVLGRDESADIHVSLDHISRIHAKIEEVEGDYFITDLGSRNGTYIQRSHKRLQVRQKPVLLEDNDIISLGHPVTPMRYRLKFKLPLVARLVSMDEFEDIHERGIKGRIEGMRKSYTLGDEAVLGRNPDCSIRSSQPTVSGRHALIQQKERGYFITLEQGASGHLNDSHGKLKIQLKPSIAYQLDENDHIILGGNENGATYQFVYSRRANNDRK